MRNIKSHNRDVEILYRVQFVTAILTCSAILLTKTGSHSHHRQAVRMANSCNGAAKPNHSRQRYTHIFIRFQLSLAYRLTD